MVLKGEGNGSVEMTQGSAACQFAEHNPFLVCSAFLLYPL